MQAPHPSRALFAGMAAANASAVIFGAAALFGRIDASPVWITFGRAFFAALALAAVATIAKVRLGEVRGDLRGMVASAALLGLHWITFFASVQLGGVAVATLTFSTFPLFALALEALHRRRRPAAVELGAGVVIVAAVALLVGPGARPGPDPDLGAVMGLTCAALFGAYGLVAQALQTRISAVALSFGQNAGVAVMLLPALAFTVAPQTPVDWAWLAVLGVVGTALVHQLYLYGLARLSAAAAGAAVAMEPVYAIAFAALIFGEPAPPAVWLSAALLVGASLALMRRPRRPGRDEPPIESPVDRHRE